MKKGKLIKPGPEPDQLKLDGNWKKATKKALEKKRPEKGWPTPEEMQANEKGQETRQHKTEPEL